MSRARRNPGLLFAALLAFALLPLASWAAPLALRFPGKAKSARTALSSGALFHAGGKGMLSQSHYQKLSSGTRLLMKAFPPEKYFYVFVGRALSSAHLFIENLDGSDKKNQLAVQMPVSGLKDYTPRGSIHVPRFNEHFEHFIPDHALRGNRTILLIDRTNQGRSLERLGDVLGDFLQTRGESVPVETLGIGWTRPTSRVNHFLSASRVKGMFVKRKGHDYEEEVARYLGTHDLRSQGLAHLRSNPAHAPYQTALQARQSRDLELRNWLAERGVAVPDAETFLAESATLSAAELEGKSRAALPSVPGHLRQIKRLVDAMAPSRGTHSIVVGVSMNAVAMTAALDAAGFSTAILPVKALGSERPPILANRNNRLWGPSEAKILASYEEKLQRTLPDERLQGVSEIVLLKPGQAGTTEILDVVTDHLRRRGYNATVRAVSVTDGSSAPIDPRSQVIKARALLSLPHKVAPPSGIFEHTPAWAKREPSYEQFRAEVGAFLSTDDQTDRE